MAPVMVFEIGNFLESTTHSRPPLLLMRGSSARRRYLCVSDPGRGPARGVAACAGGRAPRAKYTSFVGIPSKNDSGTPKFFAKSAFGVWPIQSVMLNVPNSEK